MESSASKKRGRPKKRKRGEGDAGGDGKLGPECKVQVVETTPIVMLGRYMLKEFGGNGTFLGKVVFYSDGLYRVCYEDGDFEDLESREIRGRLVSDGGFNKDLSSRRKKLDESIQRRKATNPIGVKKDKDAIETSELVAMSDGPIEEDDGDDLLSDSCENAGNSENDALPIPAPELPASSGTIGVPEQYVSHLLSLYGFLRSFSIPLFLSPFSLDDFVGMLNCHTPNTLLDAIHVAIMRALRRHLETLSANGVELASKCLRGIDWSLLDVLTWPVYLVQFMTIMGYTKGVEWKGFYDEVLRKEYFSLPAARKLLVLQVLCDSLLDSAELRSEINTREEFEFGIDCDEEAIDILENGPRRVHPRNSKTSACKDREAIGVIGEMHIDAPKGTKSDMEAADVDRNSDECRLCGMDGTLLCCDGCPSAYHGRCIGIMKLSIPEGSWFCPECVIRKIGPTIATGTSLKGADIFGIDSYGQIFLGTCSHLLVLKASANEEPYLRYYNRHDITKVVQVLCSSPQHRSLYLGICEGILKYWDVPKSVISFEETALGDSDVAKLKEESGSPSLPHHQALNDGLSNIVTVNQSNIDMKQHDGNESVGPVSKPTNPSDLTHRNLVKQSSEAGHSACNFQAALSSQSKEGNHVALRKAESNSFAYSIGMGTLYKPQAYFNQYMPGEFAASAAAKLADLTSKEVGSSESHATDSSKKLTSQNFLQTKAFSLTASRFFWPTSERKLVEVPRERCGWCLSCKSTVSSKRGCMLNHAALCATKGAMKILSGFRPIKSGEGSLASIRTYVLYLEENLHGLIVGLFINANNRKLWRKQVEQASTCSQIKSLLLVLEDNLRTIAVSSDWDKLVDDWLVEYSAIQNAASTCGTAQKRGPSKRGKKQASVPETTNETGLNQSFVWWQGGHYSKLILQKAILPCSMVKRAARQGGSRKITGLCYTDGSEIPKRSRRLSWRAAVEMSRNASQLALQVRYLDSHVRWSDLVHPEQNLLDMKNSDAEASVFRNARICSKKVSENKVSYGVAFGSQKHLPSRVMKTIIEVEKSEEQTTYWFPENRVPLYLIKVYERREVILPSGGENSMAPSNLLLQKKRPKAPRKDIFFYLVCKRDNLEICTCIICQIDLVLGTAMKCGFCKGYCHVECTVKTGQWNSCKTCYQSKVVTQNRFYNESPTSPLLVRLPQYQKPTSTKTQTPVCKSQDTISKPNNNKKSITSKKSQTPVCKSQDARAKANLVSPESNLGSKHRPKGSTWGVMWKRKNIEDTSSAFRQNNILLKGGSDHRMQPECHLCHQSYRSDLMYICCESCKKWFHADAVELEESKIFDVVGFKCCRCRRSRSPICPYTAKAERLKVIFKPLKPENSEVRSDSGTAFCPKQDEIATTANKVNTERRKIIFKPLRPENSRVNSDSETAFCPKQNEIPTPVNKMNIPAPLKLESSGMDSDSGTILCSKQSEPSTPMFPLDEQSNQGIDPLLFSLSRVELVLDPKTETDGEWDNNKPGPQKLQVRRQVKQEDDGFTDLDFSTQDQDANPLENMDLIDWDTSFRNVGGSMTFDDGGLDFENLDYEPQTLFTFSELLGVDELTADPGIPNPLVKCQRCLQDEQEPDLCCENCGVWVHRSCLSLPEILPESGGWKCSNCQEWR